MLTRFARPVARGARGNCTRPRDPRRRAVDAARNRTPPTPRFFAPVVLGAMLLLVGIRGGADIARDRESYQNNDEPRHILTAVFWHDFYRAMPLDKPSDFAFAYYGHYPAIGPLHYPPMGHWLAGLVFLVTGPSVTAARMLVLVMALLLLGATYLLAARGHSPTAGVLGAILLGGAPVLVEYRAVFMQEVPCMFWATLSILSLGAYVRSGRARWIWTASICATAAALTKQHAVALLPALLGGALMGYRRRHWSSVHAWLAPAVGLGVSGVYYAVSLAVVQGSWVDVSYVSGSLGRGLHKLLLGAGPATVVLALVAAALLLRKGRAWLARTCVLWIVGVVLLFALLPIKSPRYLMLCLPPLAILAGDLLARARSRVPTPLWWGICGALLIMSAVGAWPIPPSPFGGMRAAAREVDGMTDRGKVLYGGVFHAPFVLYRRLNDPDLRSQTVHTGKVVGSGDGMVDRHYLPLVHSPDELHRNIRSLGAELIVVEEHPEIERPEQEWLWDALSREEGYQLIRRLPVVYPNGRGGQLRCFQIVNPDPPNTCCVLPMRTLQRGSISFDPNRPLRRWGRD
jgi:dolichyl-phosphate-mannose-protein mannosyltransferase